MNKLVREYTLGRLKTNSKPVESGCIEWVGTKTKAGYGILSFTPERYERHMITAHRAMWMCTHDVILERHIYVCHKCDNPSCINIVHLFIGTAKDNTQDMINKDRYSKKRKPHTRVRVFTDEQIIAMRSEPGSLAHVAEKFGTSQGYISKLRSGKAKTLVK